MRRTNLFLGLAAVVVLCLSGGAAQAADFPTGTFSNKVGNDTWTATCKDGKVTAKRNGELAVEGTYKATKDEVEFKDVSGPLATPNDKGGKYKWKLDGKKLTFTKIEDAAEGRAGALTSGAWTME